MFGRKKNRGLSMNAFQKTQKLIGGNPGTFTPKNLPQPKRNNPNNLEVFPKVINDVDEDIPTPESSKQEDTPVQVVKQINKERKKAKKMRGIALDTFESIKSAFLLNKNKSAFIRKNKDIIKNLSSKDQKQFITIAKEHFK